MLADDYMSDPDFQNWINEISKLCNCCPECGEVPCGGVQAGDICDSATCHCDHYEDTDDHEDADPFEQAMDECGKLPTGECMLAGTEQCDFECPFSG